MALGILCVWLGCVLLWVAAHGTEAQRPWDVYQQVTGAMRAGED